MRNALTLFVLILCASSQAQVTLEISGDLNVHVVDTLEQATDILARESDGTLVIQRPSSVDPPETPKSLPYQSGWEDYNANFQDGIYYKHNNRVYLDGLLRKTSGNVADGDTMFILPIGYRPRRRLILFAKQNGEPVRVNIETNGVARTVTTTTSRDWISFDGLSFYRNPEPEVGDYADEYGGVIFYLADPPSDLNGDGQLDRGLVVSREDIGIYQWGYTGTDIPGAALTIIGSGSANTQDIVNAGQTDIAGTACANLELEGHADWFLPSQDELFEIYQNLGYNAESYNKMNPAFSNGQYWSSYEFDADEAISWSLKSGGGGVLSKTLEYNVRPIRAFQ